MIGNCIIINGVAHKPYGEPTLAKQCEICSLHSKQTCSLCDIFECGCFAVAAESNLAEVEEKIHEYEQLFANKQTFIQKQKLEHINRVCKAYCETCDFAIGCEYFKNGLECYDLVDLRKKLDNTK